MNLKFKQMYKTLLENKLKNKLIINEGPADPSKWFRALRNLMGRRFQNAFTDKDQFLRYVQRTFMGDEGPVLGFSVRVRASGSTGWGDTKRAERFIQELNKYFQVQGRKIVDVIINIDGAYIAVTDTGHYYYMSPDGGYIKLPDNFNPFTQHIPHEYNHISWFEDGYKSPLLGTEFGLGLLALDYDNIINQDGDNWHPPMAPPGAVPDYVTLPSEYQFDPEDQYMD